MSVWGVDPSVSHPAIGEWPSRNTWELKVVGAGAERLAALADAIAFFAHGMVPDDLEAVFVERPVGRVPSPELVMATGVIEASIHKALADKFAHPVSIFRLSPGEWKKAAGLKGNAKKFEVWNWALFNQPKDDISQDEADALCIAYAGHNLLAHSTEEEPHAA